MSDAESAIRQAFPGDDPLHRSVRVALLRILHSARFAQLETSFVAEFLQAAIDDPPWCLWYGPVRPRALITDLRNTANALEQACTAIDAAQPSWHLFDSRNEEASDGVRRNRLEPTTQEGDPTVPF